MITESQIRARFRKAHLRKLLEQMLQKDFYPFVNGKESETPIKWYELQPGRTIDYVIENVRFKGIEKKREDSPYAFLYGEFQDNYRSNLFWVKTMGLRLKQGATPKTYEILDYRSSKKTDVEKIDYWIEDRLLSRERFLKNNTAIDIPTSWIF